MPVKIGMTEQLARWIFCVLSSMQIDTSGQICEYQRQLVRIAAYHTRALRVGVLASHASYRAYLVTSVIVSYPSSYETKLDWEIGTYVGT